ncbi:hypothetical protein Anapl_13821 [Anas platyrhynchos]|uniref:Uncharacterized protein n=1 Tax=Anas platyrhynchos TaxID=8839 RepID=R0JJV5_ANAPL|nr:hypothetical protein Anapl_13821 [Anas platyrhynchos]
MHPVPEVRSLDMNEDKPHFAVLLLPGYEKYAGSSALLLTELELVRAEAGAPTLALALLKLQAAEDNTWQYGKDERTRNDIVWQQITNTTSNEQTASRAQLASSAEKGTELQQQKEKLLVLKWTEVQESLLYQHKMDRKAADMPYRAMEVPRLPACQQRLCSAGSSGRGKPLCGTAPLDLVPRTTLALLSLTLPTWNNAVICPVILTTGDCSRVPPSFLIYDSFERTDNAVGLLHTDKPFRYQLTQPP